MQRGTITILIILGVAVAAATASVVYHYSNQKHAAGRFGATATARLIGKPSAWSKSLELSKADAGPLAHAPTLTSPTPQISTSWRRETSRIQDEARAPTRPRPNRRVADRQSSGVRRHALDRASAKDAAARQGHQQHPPRAGARHDVRLVRATPADAEPEWQYAMAITDSKNWATVLFDFDTRQRGLTGRPQDGRPRIRKPTHDFQQFFAEQFADKPAAERRSTREAGRKLPPSSEAPAELPDTLHS